MIGAGIDIGTNTFRLLVARIGGNGLQPLIREMLPVRLGEGLGCGGLLTHGARQRAMEALTRFRVILDEQRPDTVRACATQVLRGAADGAVWIEEVRERLHIDIEVISNREEAFLGLAGVLEAFGRRLPRPLFLVDAGGGSTEMVLAVDPSDPFSSVNRVVGMKLGAVDLTERFLSPAPPDEDAVAGLSTHIEAQIGAGFASLGRSLPGEDPVVLAIGGTATALAALDLELVSYDGGRVHGHCLGNADLERMWERLRRLSAAERNRLPGLGQGRGDIILAGLRIYQLLLARLGAASMRISDSGLLEGIVLSSASLPPSMDAADLPEA